MVKIEDTCLMAFWLCYCSCCFIILSWRQLPNWLKQNPGGELTSRFCRIQPRPWKFQCKECHFQHQYQYTGAVSDFGWIFQGKHDNLPCFSLIILIQREICPIKTKSVRMWSYSSANHRDSDMTPRWSHPRKRQNMNLLCDQSRKTRHQSAHINPKMSYFQGISTFKDWFRHDFALRSCGKEQGELQWKTIQAGRQPNPLRYIEI